MTQTASLGMYEFSGTAPALDALWSQIAAGLRASGRAGVPEELTRDRPLNEVWQDPNLLLAQTCGYPLRTELRGAARLVATPVYDMPGCDGAWHRSFIIVRADAAYSSLAELRGTRLAVNGFDSNTGMNLLRLAVARVAEGQPFFSEVTVTGAHAASLAAVAEGAADVAAIDCVSFALIERERPDLVWRVRILDTTPPSPSLPLITRAGATDEEVDELRRALATAASAPELAEARSALGLRGFAVLTDDVYDIVIQYENEAIALGYPRLV